MKKVIYVPLDERPCNLLYPQYMIEGCNDIYIKTPDNSMLGNKKSKANIDEIWEFIMTEVKDAYAIVMSLEMVIYGGLLPSRIHHMKVEECHKYINNIRKIKEINKNIKIYAFNLIMRTPKYNSSDEEPDYYEEFGERIFKRAYLLDKKSSYSLDVKEEEELKEIEKCLPKEYYLDYEKRREFNLNNNIEILKLLNEGVIDYLSIPQDDSAQFGYTAIDQRKVVSKIKELKLQRKVHMYPGADEAGSALVSRAVSEIRGRRLKVYPVFSSTLGPNIVPLYEDRIIMESLKSHIMVTNSILVDDCREADIILAYNTPGKVMQESWEQEDKSITYSSFRNLLFFIEKIESYISMGKEVIVADCAFSNGGDLELIELLDSYKILDKLLSYKGWNTNCNTLGTTLAAGVIAYGSKDRKYIKKNLIYHILEDGIYQAKIRRDITNNTLPKLGVNYFSLGEKTELVKELIDTRLYEEYTNLIDNSFKDIKIEMIDSFSPWNRMFECGINLVISKS
ncbi:DUF4127 family protein [Clostridium paraputrificum]|uniref:DUF4127 family protein n=1 Tax=Clostridium paraputrificum TaxID=29363 RepID=UPI00325BFDA0